jgi:hypothetical protein
MFNEVKTKLPDLQVKYVNCSRGTIELFGFPFKCLILIRHCCNINVNKK